MVSGDSMTTASSGTSSAVRSSEVSLVICKISLGSVIILTTNISEQEEFPVNSVLRPSLPPSNLYFLSISRIREMKTGPFFEHSSQLYSIATGVANWGKVHSGLFKMYEVCDMGIDLQVIAHEILLLLISLCTGGSSREKSGGTTYTRWRAC